MNFLAHYLSAAHLPSPGFHTGAILPDISRRAGFRILPQHISPHPKIHPELAAGIRLHWLGDELFHQSELFHRCTEVWKNSLHFRHQPAGRRYFLFHLLAEMWLDRQLLELFPYEATDFYRSLADFPEHSLKGISDRLRDSEANLWSTFQDFQQRRFIHDYANPERFASIAAGVFAYASRLEFSPDLKTEILRSLPATDLHKGEICNLWAVFIGNLRRKWEEIYQNSSSE